MIPLAQAGAEGGLDQALLVGEAIAPALDNLDVAVERATAPTLDDPHDLPGGGQDARMPPTKWSEFRRMGVTWRPTGC